MLRHKIQIRIKIMAKEKVATKPEGIKDLLRKFYAKENAAFTLAQLMTKTEKTEKQLHDAIYDLSNPAYSHGPSIRLVRGDDGKYAIGSAKASKAASKKKGSKAKKASAKPATAKASASEHYVEVEEPLGRPGRLSPKEIVEQAKANASKPRASRAKSASASPAAF